MVGVLRTLENPVSVLNDLEGIKNVLTLSKNTGVKRVFYSSSSEVYGEPVHLPQNETTTPLNSRLPYAIVKNVGEAFCKSYQQEFGLDYTIFRFFNTYGPKQSVDFVMSKFLRLAMKNEPITIYGDGSQTRTLELAKILIKLTNSKSEIIHLPTLKDGDMTRRQPDIAKMKQLLNRDLLPLEQGIKRVIEKGNFF